LILLPATTLRCHHHHVNLYAGRPGQKYARISKRQCSRSCSQHTPLTPWMVLYLNCGWKHNERSYWFVLVYFYLPTQQGNARIYPFGVCLSLSEQVEEGDGLVIDPYVHWRSCCCGRHITVWLFNRKVLYKWDDSTFASPPLGSCL
jgi:hypothetical protein